MASLTFALLSLASLVLGQVSQGGSDFVQETSTTLVALTLPTPTTVTTRTSTGSVIPSATDYPAEIVSGANYTVVQIQDHGSVDPRTFSNNSAVSQVRSVAYRITEHGNAVIDGDIIFGTEAELRAAIVNGGPAAVQKRAFSLLHNSPRKWPGARVLYKYEPGLSQAHIDYFQEGVKQWTDRLPWLRFEQSNAANARTVRASSGNSSPVGCCGGDIELCPTCNPRSARHEIGHTLGLYHEHQRPDRGDYVDLVCPGGVCSQEVLANLGINSGVGRNWAGSYDINSLMHYSLSGSLGGGSFQLVPKPGVVFNGPAQVPSKLDVARVCELYWEQCHSICGDGILSPGAGEQCDDGNNINGDDCSSSCKKETPSCLATCNPLPPNNVCGFRSSCTLFNPVPNRPNSGNSFCMCQAGYRGSNLALDGEDQYRVSWLNSAGGQTHRVFVKPGQECGVVCNTVDCAEVPIKNSCR